MLFTKRSLLVSDDGRELLQQAAEGGVFRGLRLLQISRSVSSVKILQRETDLREGLQ